ncbi:hypothetical protein ACN47E_003603 [Coniothyrium glycines]
MERADEAPMDYGYVMAHDSRVRTQATQLNWPWPSPIVGDGDNGMRTRRLRQPAQLAVHEQNAPRRECRCSAGVVSEEHELWGTGTLTVASGSPWRASATATKVGTLSPDTVT